MQPHVTPTACKLTHVKILLKSFSNAFPSFCSRFCLPFLLLFVHFGLSLNALYVTSPIQCFPTKNITCKYVCMYVVYFNQLLGAAHSKSWLKQSFSVFLTTKNLKKAKFFAKKHVFLSLHLNAGLLFYSQECTQLKLKQENTDQCS